MKGCSDGTRHTEEELAELIQNSAVGAGACDGMAGRRAGELRQRHSAPQQQECALDQDHPVRRRSRGVCCNAFKFMIAIAEKTPHDTIALMSAGRTPCYPVVLAVRTEWLANGLKATGMYEQQSGPNSQHDPAPFVYFPVALPSEILAAAANADPSWMCLFKSIIPHRVAYSRQAPMPQGAARQAMITSDEIMLMRWRRRGTDGAGATPAASASRDRAGAAAPPRPRGGHHPPPPPPSSAAALWQAQLPPKCCSGGLLRECSMRHHQFQVVRVPTSYGAPPLHRCFSGPIVLALIVPSRVWGRPVSTR